ncbi:hypothetical protein DJ533_00095 (plasmid) [Acinetobacter defluvii]|uniref:Uncharacterized protein n=1 Tax=Acinetobacter defluvii TaxID=1871111 RepID=A0A2S2F873_9GAMM|nr:hypothetical protein [Acinetobacter defluvii]AWL27120.1 hypothetical protein DJ533_00095 [Acinetobacter defluvii]
MIEFIAILLGLIAVFIWALREGTLSNIPLDSDDLYEWLVVFKDLHGGTYRTVMMIDTDTLNAQLLNTLEAELSAEFDKPCITNIMLLGKAAQFERLDDFKA